VERGKSGAAAPGRGMTVFFAVQTPPTSLEKFCELALVLARFAPFFRFQEIDTTVFQVEWTLVWLGIFLPFQVG